MKLSHTLLSRLLEEVRPVITEEFYMFMRKGCISIATTLSGKKAEITQITVESQSFILTNTLHITFYDNTPTRIIIRMMDLKESAYSELASEERLNESLIIEALYEASKLYSRVNHLREDRKND